MSDLISRQAAIDALMEVLDRPNHAEFLYTDEICGVLRSLPSAQPTIDAEPVRHGKWTVTPIYIKCSECGESFMLIPQNYCPYCGADMRGEEEWTK